MQRLQNHDGSDIVTISKGDLERDILFDDDRQPMDDVTLVVDRLNEKVYVIRSCDGDVPELAEYEVIQRLAAHQML